MLLYGDLNIKKVTSMVCLVAEGYAAISRCVDWPLATSTRTIDVLKWENHL
jgi:hypothetical protein